MATARPGGGDLMGAHEIVIRFGRAFDIRARGSYIEDVREITVPFAHADAVIGALADVEVFIRPVHDAGGEDYRPVVAGQVITTEVPVPPAVLSGLGVTAAQWDELDVAVQRVYAEGLARAGHRSPPGRLMTWPQVAATFGCAVAAAVILLSLVLPPAFGRVVLAPALAAVAFCAGWLACLRLRASRW